MSGDGFIKSSFNMAGKLLGWGAKAGLNSAKYGLKQIKVEDGATWGDGKDIFSPSHTGFMVGGTKNTVLSLSDSTENLCLISPTGRGKTSTFVVPSVISICQNRPGYLQPSVILSDPTGALYTKLSGYFISQGYVLEKIDPENIHASASFNPLEGITSKVEVSQLVEQLISFTYFNSSDPFWGIQSAILIQIVLEVLMEKRDQENDPDCFSLANCLYILQAFMSNKNAHHFIRRYADVQTLHRYKGFLAGKSEKLLSSILASAITVLSKLDDKNLSSISARSSLDFSRLRRFATVYFLSISHNNASYYGWLGNLLCGSLFSYLTSSYPTANDRPVFFILEELGNLLKLEGLDKFLTLSRQHLCPTALIMQDFSQMELIYGEKESSVLTSGGCNHALYYGGMNIEDCLTLEKTLGTRSFHRFTEDKYKDRFEEPLLSAADIRMLPDNQAIFISANRKPILIKDRTPYFRVREFIHATSFPAYHYQGHCQPAKYINL